jgi:hypothetical protein
MPKHMSVVPGRDHGAQNEDPRPTSRIPEERDTKSIPSLHIPFHLAIHERYEHASDRHLLLFQHPDDLYKALLTEQLRAPSHAGSIEKTLLTSSTSVNTPGAADRTSRTYGPRGITYWISMGIDGCR